ncbi:3-hydroxyacyl-CoA dehydrogenase family protein [Sellimonas intestinalis]|uniref:3-hydroxyacyl-CoA dehydrogenase family protein n=1 Tax=Sellimonas intestinalis TaxID=1653434 RepID=UPI0015EBA768|nr:3-hydroxyacyl-CoA dehydrogenase family protein [Sellimonas intestinalis]MBA2213312.1 3-hydroxyacyl-CoA dehydrogenase family protein [Sellimonas intestinalis]
MKELGVIGAGTMGIDVTIDALFHGFKVLLIDVDENTLKNAKKKISRTMRMGSMLGLDYKNYSQEQIDEQLILSSDISNVKDCDVIVENICENYEAKEKVYVQLNKICSEDTLFIANTSCISITRIAKNVDNPRRVIGVHFMNPVYLKTTVEVIKGFHTDDEYEEKTKRFITNLGKKGIIVNDYPGFVSNRISHLFMNEAAYVVMDGVASAKQVDDIFKQCFGHKMGPLETADLIGLDVVVDSLEVLYESYQDSKFRCCPLLKKMLDAGFLGRKSGKGFYNY